MADPRWLLNVVRAGKADADALIAQEPVRLHLVPAARSLLAARRSCPASARVHAELGVLTWLTDPSEPTAAHIGRALRTAGADSPLLAYAAGIAARAGDPLLAAQGWQLALRAGATDWEAVADQAGAALSADQIAERVIPRDRGRYALYFADRLYGTPRDAEARRRLLRLAANRLADDDALPEADRLHLEAQAWAGLEEPAKARDRMSAALARSPERMEWRHEYINWLLAWDDPREAHKQALAWTSLSPESAQARRLLVRVAEALARGTSRPPGNGPK
jgi:hypothetical protein